MRRCSSVAIVADGRERILKGSARQAGLRIHTRLMRRCESILDRAGFVGRMIARFRIWRLVRRQTKSERHSRRAIPPAGSPRSRRRVAAHFEQMRPLHPMTN